MLNARIARIFGCVLATATCVATAQQTQPSVADRDFPMGKAGTLRLGVPPEWKDDSILSDGDSMAASMLDFTSWDDSGPIRVQIVSFPPAKIDPNLASDDSLQRICRAQAAKAIDAAKVKELKLDAFAGGQVRGFSFSVANEKGSKEHSRVTGGAVKLGQLVLVFTIYHQNRQPSLDTATAIVRDARLVADASAATTKPAAPVALPGPGDAWSVQIPKLVISPSRFVRRKQGDTLSYTLTDRVSGVGLDALIEPAQKRGGATIARSYYHNLLKQGRTELSKVKLQGNDRKAVLRYGAADMQFISVYLVHDKMWTSVTFYCAANDQEALKLMEQAADSVRIAE
jgi:hypothetical protein